jgi:hypothetical protein
LGRSIAAAGDGGGGSSFLGGCDLFLETYSIIMKKASPFHKNTTLPPAGQTTLADYIKEIQEREEPKKKLSFEEWWQDKQPLHDAAESFAHRFALMAWNASRENM